MKDQDPMDRLRRANPAPLGPPARKSSRSGLRRAGQAFLALLGILVVGVGAAWAANGTNPVASFFTKDLKQSESLTGLDTFSILEPSTQENFDALHPDIAFRAFTIAVSKSTMANLRNGDPPFKEHGPSRSPDYDPVPAEISAIGHGTTTYGDDVTMLVIDDEICTYLDQGHGPSNCSTVTDIENGEAVAGYRGRSGGRLWRVLGVVPDEVVAIRIEGSDLPPVPVSSNVFDLRNLESRNTRLSGLDEEGEEVLRSVAPLGNWSGLGDPD